MVNITELQFNIMFVMMGVCVCTIIFTLVSRSLSHKRRSVILGMGFASLFYIIADRITYIYNGVDTHAAFYIVRMSYFFDYLSPYFLTFLFTLFLTDVLLNEGKLRKIPLIIDITQLVTFVGAVLVVASQSNNLYYTISIDNYYERSSSYPLSYICPVIIFILIFITIITYGKSIKRSEQIAFHTFIFLPGIVAFMQFFFSNLSLTCLSFVFPLLLMFIIELHEMDMQVREAKERELNLLNEKKNDTEAQLEEKNKMLEADFKSARKENEEKIYLLSCMAKNIRTPVNEIVAYTDKAIKNQEDKGVIYESLMRLSRSGEEMLRFVNDIHDLSMLEEGTFKITEDKFSFKKLEKDIYNLYQREASKKSIKLEVDIQNVRHETVYCCKKAIHRVVLNLLSNAINYSNSYGHVKVKIEEFEISGQKDVANFCFTIEDNGIGMSEEFVKKLFYPIERKQTPSNTNQMGTGMGMVIVKKVLDLINGSIDIESKKRIGTKVLVQIPLKISDSEK